MQRLGWLLYVLALGAAACSSNDHLTPVTPTTPTTTVDTFSGTLNPSGGRTHTFATVSSGAVNAVLTSISPDSSLVVGLSLGTWNGNACQTVLAKDDAVQGSSVVANANAAGNLCARIYDVGNLKEAISYTIEVRHP